MTGDVEKVKDELQTWEHVWKMLETFVNRVESARGKDDEPARAYGALSLIFRICVDEVWRQGGFLPGCKPPGLAEHDDAVGGPKLDWDGESDLAIFRFPPEMLFEYLDAGNQVTPFWCPSFSSDALPRGLPAEQEDGGLFGEDARETAAADGDADLELAWSTLWSARMGTAMTQIADGVDEDPAAWYHPDEGDPGTAADRCTTLAALIEGVAGDVPAIDGWSAASTSALAAHYRALADLYTKGDLAGAETVRSQLLVLAAPFAGPVHPAVEVLNELTEDRIGYPDGTLRALRAMEDALRWVWVGRKGWYTRRARRLSRRLDPILDRVAAGLAGALTGHTRAGVSGRLVADRRATYGTRQLICEPMSVDQAGVGQIVAVDGNRTDARSVLALVTGWLVTPTHTELQTTPLWFSLADSPTGTMGLSRNGATVGAAVTLAVADVKQGFASGDRARDGLVTGFRALWTRLRLIRGGQIAGVHDDLLATPIAVVTWDPGSPLSTTIAPTATRLVARLGGRTDLVETTLSGWEARFARAGEVLLLRGTASGTTWQVAVDVVDVEVTTEAAWTSGGEPDLTCDVPELVVLTILPPGLVGPFTGAELRRDFQGFGQRSLASNLLLPATLDDDPKTRYGREGVRVHREPEFAAAARILRQWLGMTP